MAKRHRIESQHDTYKVIDGKLLVGAEGCFPPTSLPLLPFRVVRSVSCSPVHFAIVTRDGELYTAGKGNYFQLGHGHSNDESMPRLVQALSEEKIVQAACGLWHTLCVTEMGGK
jgi:alpha-tubulin suppressor-like RCC1 family protein